MQAHIPAMRAWCLAAREGGVVLVGGVIGIFCLFFREVKFLEKEDGCDAKVTLSKVAFSVVVGAGRREHFGW